MTNLKSFWPALEKVPGLAVSRLDWQQLLGEAWPHVKGFLSPRQELARSYACPNPKNSGVVHAVVQHDEDTYVGVCPADCGTMPVTPADIVVYQVDVGRLNQTIALAFDITSKGSPVTDLHQTFDLGIYVAKNDRRIPAYITYQLDRNDLLQVVRGLSLWVDRPYILLTPTTGLWSTACQMALRTAQSHVVALADNIVAHSAGRFRSKKTLDELLLGTGRLTRKTAGRRKLSTDEFADREKLWQDWQCANGQGASRKEFCEARGITLTELDNIRRLLQQRQRRRTN